MLSYSWKLADTVQPMLFFGRSVLDPQLDIGKFLGRKLARVSARRLDLEQFAGPGISGHDHRPVFPALHDAGIRIHGQAGG